MDSNFNLHRLRVIPSECYFQLTERVVTDDRSLTRLWQKFTETGPASRSASPDNYANVNISAVRQVATAAADTHDMACLRRVRLRNMTRYVSSWRHKKRHCCLRQELRCHAETTLASARIT